MATMWQSEAEYTARLIAGETDADRSARRRRRWDVRRWVKIAEQPWPGEDPAVLLPEGFELDQARSQLAELEALVADD